MEIRELRSFLAIVRHESMTRAAEELHLTQSTLSKQVKSLEAELGRKLFERHSFGITLTEEGRLLHERAADLVSVADRIETEFADLDKVTGGTLYFGLAESFQIKYLAQQIRLLQESCPELTYHVASGVTSQVTSLLDAGVIDFAVLAEEPDHSKYDSLAFPEEERWGVVMATGCPLAQKKEVAVKDLVGLPLFCSDQAWRNDIPRWAGRAMGRLKRAASFGLAYNGAIFAREGLGYLLTFDKIVDTSNGSGVVFRPLSPSLGTRLHLVWRKNRALTPIAEKFLAQARESLGRRRQAATADARVEARGDSPK